RRRRAARADGASACRRTARRAGPHGVARDGARFDMGSLRRRDGRGVSGSLEGMPQLINFWTNLAAMTVCAASIHMPTPIVEKPIRTIGVFINGERLRSETSPQVVGGRLYLPMRTVFAALGIDVF